MNVQAQIDKYISDQTPERCEDMQKLHHIIQNISPGFEIRFLDGRNRENKIVSNPNIGYGSRVIKYATGATREF